MFVSDSNIFPPSNMRVRITSMDGVDLLVECSPSMNVDELKMLAMRTLFNPVECMSNSLHYKLILVRTGQVLNLSSSLGQEGLLDNDELLLVSRRLRIVKMESAEKKEEGRKAPTSDQINKATASLERTGKLEEVDDLASQLDFQSELRKILISLIDASQKILCMTEEAPKIFKQAKEILSGPSSPTAFDEKTLKQLTEMGFPELKAKKALIQNRMSMEAAMDWLFQHEMDPEDSEDDVATSEMQEEEPVPDEQSHPENNVRGMLELFQSLRKKDFQPNRRILQNLMEMGFGEEESVDALRLTRNDQQSACDLLLGDRQNTPSDFDEGLDTDGPIFKAIMSNPTVQLGLNNPRCLLAFLQMLDNPIAASQWLNDPDTGPILVQISRIYHAEKHSSKTTVPETTKETREIR